MSNNMTPAEVLAVLEGAEAAMLAAARSDLRPVFMAEVYIPSLQHARAAVAALVAERDALRSALVGMLNIVNDSRGVVGYHLNGEVAAWDYFDDEVNAASAALSGADHE